ncbi:MAG TPA: cytochrome c3 family protein [candidate division Zixibacteria bacterium]|nr:cytochrome c3 family protein [candidate division Zixibacteria bacterium]
MRRQLMCGAVVLAVVALGAASALSEGSGSVFDSKHNLSVTGKGEIKSNTETRVCIFCHSSHSASSEGPLWNHESTATPRFKTYERSTMNSAAEQPNGATKLCLSCHDGTIAVGAIRGLSRPIQMQSVTSSGAIPASRKSNFGADLTGTHPVSVKFLPDVAQADERLRWPPLDPAGEVGVDANGYVQCTSCHDPHDDSKSERYPFWQKETFDEVCDVCHRY